MLGEGVQLPHQAMSFQDGSAPPRRGVRGAAASGVRRVRSLIEERRARSKGG